MAEVNYLYAGHSFLSTTGYLWVTQYDNITKTASQVSAIQQAASDVASITELVGHCRIWNNGCSFCCPADMLHAIFLVSY